MKPCCYRCAALLRRGARVFCGLLSLALLSFPAVGGEVPREADAERLQALRQEALALEHGEGVPRDTARAARLYCDGARLGDPEAQFASHQRALHGSSASPGGKVAEVQIDPAVRRQREQRLAHETAVGDDHAEFGAEPSNPFGCDLVEPVRLVDGQTEFARRPRNRRRSEHALTAERGVVAGEHAYDLVLCGEPPQAGHGELWGSGEDNAHRSILAEAAMVQTQAF